MDIHYIYKNWIIMKRLLLIFLTIHSLNTFGQNSMALADSAEDEKNNSNKTFKKLMTNNYVFLSDSVEIDNGLDQKVKVFFEGDIPIEVFKNWPKFMSEEEYFAFIANNLSINAKFSLTNNESFEPIRKQIFIFQNGEYVSAYKLLGRDKLGKVIEGMPVVKFNPLNPTGSKPD